VLDIAFFFQAQEDGADSGVFEGGGQGRGVVGYRRQWLCRIAR